MKVSDIQNVAVIGAGLMGHGIAQEFAQAGYQVRLTDVSDTVLERARKTIQGNLDMMTGFGLIDAEQAAAVLPAIQA